MVNEEKKKKKTKAKRIREWSKARLVRQLEQSAQSGRLQAKNGGDRSMKDTSRLG